MTIVALSTLFLILFGGWVEANASNWLSYDSVNASLALAGWEVCVGRAPICRKCARAWLSIGYLYHSNAHTHTHSAACLSARWKRRWGGVAMAKMIGSIQFHNPSAHTPNARASTIFRFPFDFNQTQLKQLHFFNCFLQCSCAYHALHLGVRVRTMNKFFICALACIVTTNLNSRSLSQNETHVFVCECNKKRVNSTYLFVPLIVCVRALRC